MIKINGVLKELKNVQPAKYIVSTVSNLPNNNTVTELVPIDWEGKLPNPIPISELGKHLIRAAGEGNVEELKNLLTKGAPFTADWLGTSPLHLAAQNNHIGIVEILLRAGISKDARTKVDRTPLHMAAYEGHIQIVDALVKHGADIDCKDLLTMSPLHWAVQNGHFEIVEYLINNGAELNEPNKFELTPIMIARQIGRCDIENILNGALVDSTLAAQNLVIQLASEDALADQNKMENMNVDVDLEDNGEESIVIPLEPSILEQLSQENVDMEENSQTDSDIQFEEPSQEYIEKTNKQLEQSTHFSDQLKLLHDGMTMLQDDEIEDGHILNSVMENGHSVVLTDVGKEVLNSVKELEQKQQQTVQPLHMQKKIITITPEEFLAMTKGALNKNAIKQIKTFPNKNNVKRLLVRKPKVFNLSQTVTTKVAEHIQEVSTDKTNQNSDIESVMNQLVQARKTIEEYKIKLQKKEQEVEQYKMQLKLLMDAS